MPLVAPTFLAFGLSLSWQMVGFHQKVAQNNGGGRFRTTSNQAIELINAGSTNV
jgi:hypothetical protein